jgi:predicted RNA methylase
MPIHQRAVAAVKRRFVRAGRRPTRVKAGIARGCPLLLDRRVDVQREFGLYESETHSIIRAEVKPGSIVLDVGTGDGYEAVAYARLGATVYAFEPHAEAVARLRGNLGLNPGLAERVTVFPSSFPARDPPSGADFAKVDVDGAELAVLEHLVGIPTILIETHSARLEDGCRTLLSQHGYQTRVIRNARCRALYPEHRPIGFNRWLLAQLAGSGTEAGHHTGRH